MLTYPKSKQNQRQEDFKNVTYWFITRLFLHFYY